VGLRYNPPPGWPPAPGGFTPEPGWKPDPSWPPPPPGWQLWVNDDGPSASAPSSAPPWSPQASSSSQPDYSGGSNYAGASYGDDSSGGDDRTYRIRAGQRGASDLGGYGSDSPGAGSSGNDPGGYSDPLRPSGAQYGDSSRGGSDTYSFRSDGFGGKTVTPGSSSNQGYGADTSYSSTSNEGGYGADSQYAGQGSYGGGNSSFGGPADNPGGYGGAGNQYGGGAGSPYGGGTGTAGSSYGGQTPAGSSPYGGPAAAGSPYGGTGAAGSPYGGAGAGSPYGGAGAAGSPYGGPAGGPAPYPGGYDTGMPPRNNSTNGFAIVSLVLGIIGGAVLSAIFGFLALAKIKRTGQRGRGMAIAGIVLSGVWVVVLVIVIISAQGQATRGSNGQINKAGNLSVFSLAVGDCFMNPSSQQDIASVTAIPCTQPHDAQVFAKFNASGSSYPSNFTQLASSGCSAQENRLNQSLVTSSMTIRFIFPNQAAWEAGTHTVNCLVVSPTNISSSLLNS
jgi:Domain of unknown function (DUF4190)/Septum formation